MKLIDINGRKWWRDEYGNLWKFHTGKSNRQTEPEAVKELRRDRRKTRALLNHQEGKKFFEKIWGIKKII